ncbi:MAG: hypothetical protein K2K93_07540 [Muribaculaceae bacterium]|nr:hypothetical protein [Muribaculaceae bacterium]
MIPKRFHIERKRGARFKVSLPAIAIVLCLALILQVTATASSPRVIDGATGKPLSGIKVFDRSGKLIGTCSADGSMPTADSRAYPLTLRSLGYEDTTIASPSDTSIIMIKTPVALPEVKVDTRRRPILHLTGYLREISTLASSTDTLMLYREKWVDFMLPAENEKKFRARNIPRILKTKSYYRFTDAYGRDSVSDRVNHHFSWSDWISLPGRIAYPSKIAGSRQGTDTLMGKYSPAEIWHKEGDKARVYVNVLADTIKRKWAPRLGGSTWKDLDFERMVMEYSYSDIDTFAVKPANIDGISCYIESMGRGHDMFRFNRNNDLIYVTTYFDLTIADREYITVKEARRKERDPLAAIEDGVMIFQSDIMPRDSIISELIARVEDINHDERRLAMEIDTRVGNGTMPERPVYTRKEKFIRGLKHTLSFLGFK